VYLYGSDPSVTVVGGDVYDAGIPAGGSVIHTFTVLNPHPYPVALTSGLQGCACTTVTASASSISAHGSATVTLKVAAEDGDLNGAASFATSRGSASAQTLLTITDRKGSRSPSDRR
jgi:hypothetical protein